MYKVYYTDPVDSKAYSWDCEILTDALTVSERFRKEGMSFVTMVSQNPNVVGKPGVDAVEDGILPNGSNYTWKKRRI
jgi:hypothetical protein